MLTYKLLKNHAGIQLCGDYDSLKSLYQAIHDINDNSPLIRDKEGMFLGMAYDVRKAYEGQRKIIKRKVNPEYGNGYGVEILWPVLLIQLRMFRSALAYFDSSKIQQSWAFNLEDLIEDALQADFSREKAPELIANWMRIDPRHPETVNLLNSRGGLFCALSKADRKKYMNSILLSFDPMYGAFYDSWVRNGAKDLINPKEFTVWDENDEWVDPKW